MKKNIIPTFSDYSQCLIDRLKEEGRFGTSRTYSKTRASFLSFIKDIRMSEIDRDTIRRYNRYLAGRGVIRNTLSFYNRVLRAMYNKALKEYGFADAHPFDSVYTGIDRTSSRAASEKSIAILATMDLPEVHDREALSLTRDMFLFSYVMRGMPFVDMVYLKKSQIKNGVMTYSRRKTGRTLRIKVEGEALFIINKYSQKNGGSEYVFPILDDHHGRKKTFMPEEAYLRYSSSLSLYNRNLRRLSSMAGIADRLTSYVSRHSWATAAQNIGSGVSVISAALGHSSERMTKIYLGNLNSVIIDDTNRKLLDRLDRYCFSNMNKNVRKFRTSQLSVSTKETK